MDVDSAEEELSKRHKQERKDLQATIQSLKKSIPKGDKKKKKEITEEIAKLEADLNRLHEAELDSSKGNSETETTEPQIEAPQDDLEEPPPSEPRISRAAKRRNKKLQEEKEREKRISEQAEKNREGPRLVELNAIKEALKSSKLKLFNIPADGNCLYCAVNHQLDVTGREPLTVAKLRKVTAEFLRQNKDEFMPFMYSETEEQCSDEFFEAYCKEVANTKLWGGQLELRALSNALMCPIKVIQANGPPTIQGENFKGPELILTYHRHLYRLGEHYNSTIICHESEEDN